MAEIQNHQEVFDFYLQLTDVIWEIDKTSIEDILTQIKLGFDKYDLKMNYLINIINTIASHRLWCLEKFVSLFKRIQEIYEISNDLNFSCFELKNILIKCNIITQELSYDYEKKTTDEMYQIFPKNTIAHALFWDDIQEFQHFSGTDDFNFNQSVNFEFLIDMAAKYGIVKYFKLIYLNNAKLSIHTLEKSFIGNKFEIINICEQSFSPNRHCIENCVKWYRNDSLQYLKSKYDLDFSFLVSLTSYNFLIFDQMLNEVNDIEYLDCTGRTAFSSAVEFGFLPIVEYLLDKNPQINKIYGKENPPLIISLFKYDEKLTKTLLDKNADPNITNSSGMSALMYAANTCNIDAIELLLKYNADVNKTDNENRSALVYAIKANFKEVVEVLIKYGADATISDKSGKTPLEYAKNIDPKSSITKIITKYLESKNSD